MTLSRYDLEGTWRYAPYRTHRDGIAGRARRALIRFLDHRDMVLMSRERFDLEQVAEGHGRPANAETMMKPSITFSPASKT